MTRRTSVDAYHKIRDEGLLGLKAFVVYEVLFHKGPMTAGEIFSAMQEQGDKIIVKGGVSARLTEMREDGAVAEVGTRVCSVTGQTVLLWDVTDQLPVQKDKPKRIDLQVVVEEQGRQIAAILKEIHELKTRQFDDVGQGALFNGAYGRGH